jgi:hypothetical protein
LDDISHGPSISSGTQDAQTSHVHQVEVDIGVCITEPPSEYPGTWKGVVVSDLKFPLDGGPMGGISSHTLRSSLGDYLDIYPSQWRKLDELSRPKPLSVTRTRVILFLHKLFHLIWNVYVQWILGLWELWVNPKGPTLGGFHRTFL